MLVSLSRDAKEQIGLLAIKIDSIGILLQNNARALDGILRLACSVRDGDAHAQVDAGDLVSFHHRIDIRLVDAAHLDELLARRPDGIDAPHAGEPQLNT